MNKKEKLRQELLEQTFGKNAKNRRLSSYNISKELKNVSQDLEDIINYQQESMNELSQSLSHEDIERLNQEVQNDFGMTIKKQTKGLDVQSLEDIEEKLKKNWHYHGTIHEFISAIQKSLLMDKKEYSLLFYGIKDHVLKDIFNDFSNLVYHQDIVYLNFKDYIQQLDIFYQDIFHCLYGEEKVIVIDSIESLPISFIQPMLSLLQNKEMILTKRYVEMNGNLKETTNQLVKKAISSLAWYDKIIVMMTKESLQSFTDRFGLPFVRVIDECKEFQSLSYGDYQNMLLDKYQKWKDYVQKQLSIEWINDDIYQYLLNEKKVDADNVLEDLFEKIIDYKDELKKLEFIYRDHLLYLKKGDEQINMIQREDSTFDEIDQQLKELIGLQEVKEYLQSLKQYYATVQKRTQQGKKVMEISKHMIFIGNPGTGKTTVARILAQYLKSAGILESGHLIEVSRKDLVGQYVGHTAVQTSQVISSSLGGVLFIDEAYSLYRGSNDSFGLEAIDTLVKAMEDKRDSFVVVLAGYRKEMEEFLESNSGLRSRFSNIIEFKDYTGEELYQIACAIAKGKEYIIDEQCHEYLVSYLEKKNQLEGGNGRLARTCVEKAMIHQASRNAQDDLLILEDFDVEGSEKS